VRLIRRSTVLAGLALCGVALGAATAHALDAPGHHGPASDHFDGEKFKNLVPTDTKDFLDVLAWRLKGGHRGPPWPDHVEAAPGVRPPTRVGAGELRVTFVGHATLLVQVDGVNVLTDPVWSDRVGPVAWLGSKRVRPPGLRFDDLPPIDVVVVSHDHYDHLDVPTLRRLAARDHPRIVAGLGTAALLAGEGIQGGVDLDWWQAAPISDTVRVTLVPAQHWSRRGVFDTSNTLWGGFVVEARGGPVYFAGDTGWGPHFELVRQAFGPVRLAMLPIGAYQPRWFMRPQHMGPEEAVDASRVLAAQVTVPMHFGTFHLGDDGPEEGVQALRAYAELTGGADSFWVLGFGEGRDVPPLAGGAEQPVAASSPGRPAAPPVEAPAPGAL